MKTFSHVSASQLETFADASAAPFVGGEGCNRKWYFSKILGFETPPTDSTIRGQLIHKDIENYLHSGDEAHLKNGLAQAKRFLPAPADVKSGKVKIEHHFRLPVDDTGIEVIGYIDLYSRLRVDDHKTSASPQWFKTAEDLRKNTQMLLYGYRNALEFSMTGQERILLAHNQLHVPKGTVTVVSAQRTEAYVTVAETIKAWKERIVPTVRRMKEVAVIDDVSQVTPNWSACTRFGGCPFRDKCTALKAAGAGGSARSPFAGLNPTLSHPLPQESAMPAPTLPPHLARAVGRTAAGPNPAATASAAAQDKTVVAPGTPTQATAATPRLPPGVKVGGVTPVASVGAAQAAAPKPVVAKATGVVPPDAPNPRAAPAPAVAKPAAPVATSSITFTPNAPKVATNPPADATDEQKSESLLALGWSAEEIGMMDETVFNKAYAEQAKRESVELVMDKDHHGEFIKDFAAKPAPAPAPVAPRRRGFQGIDPKAAAPAPAPVEETFWYFDVDANDFAKLSKIEAASRNSAGKETTYIGDDAAKEEYEAALSADAQAAAEAEHSVETAQEQEGSEEVTEAATDGEIVGAPKPGTARQPRNAAKRLAALGYTEGQIQKMSTDTMQVLLEGDGVEAKYVSVLADGRAKVFDVEGDVSAEAGKALTTDEPTVYQQVEKAVRDVALIPSTPAEAAEGERRRVETTNQILFGSKEGPLVLYIDCVPSTPYTDFAAFIAPHADAVAKAHGAENIWDLDKLFGRGPGLVAARLLLPANRPTGALVIDSRHPFAQACIADLSRFATGIVRAVAR